MISRFFFILALSSLYPNHSYAAHCYKSFLNQDLIFEPDFSKWSNDELIKQTKINYHFLTQVPYSYPDQYRIVENRIIISGLPGKENSLNVRELLASEISGQVFRFYLTKEELKKTLQTNRLVAHQQAYCEGPYYYEDMTGILLTLPQASKDEAAYIRPEYTDWIDVTLDVNLSMFKVGKNSFLVPGATATQPWLINEIKRGASTPGAQKNELLIKKMNTIGWSAMEIPILSTVASSIGSAPKPLEMETKVAPQYIGQPLFKMQRDYIGEEKRVGKEKVVYFSETERQKYKINCNSEGQIIDSEGNIFSSLNASTPSLGSLLPDGSLMLARDQNTPEGLIQHSSFNSGQPVLTAFEFLVNNEGHLLIATDASGHYLPSKQSVFLAIDLLRKMGCKLDGFHFQTHL